MTFDRLIRLDDNEALTATFTRVHAPTEKFFVEISGREGRPSSFEMHRDERRGWRISHPAPSWVFSLEEKLAEAINGKTAPDDNSSSR